jgi:signal peptide peptidase SppA
MSRHYDHVLSFALEHPWAVTPSTRPIIAGILARRVAGHDTDPAEIQAALVNRKNLPQPAKGTVALIPFYGIVAPRMNLLSEFSGGTTFEALTQQLQAAVANPDVKTIVFDVDSQGGNVAGATEFAREMLKARAQKPIIAVAQYLMASAAYWAMACATEIVAAPSAKVGANECYALYDDISDALAKEGIKREVISAGKFRVEGVDGGPLSPEMKVHIKALCDTFYGYQVADIAKGRGVKESDVRNGFGEGRVITATDALALGMIDRIGTLAETLARVRTPVTALGVSAPLSSTLPDDTTAGALRPPVQDRRSNAQWQVAALGALETLGLEGTPS